MKNLKPSTDYRLTEADWRFVCELAKVGYVHVLTNQVSLIAETTGRKDAHSISFVEYGGGDENRRCQGLKLPDHWLIEHISSSSERLSITFFIKPETK